MAGDDLIIGTVPGLERRCLAVECGTVHLVNQNAEESGRLLVVVGPNLILDVDDETRGHRGEKTGLCSPNVSSVEATNNGDVRK